MVEGILLTRRQTLASVAVAGLATADGKVFGQEATGNSDEKKMPHAEVGDGAYTQPSNIIVQLEGSPSSDDVAIRVIKPEEITPAGLAEAIIGPGGVNLDKAYELVIPEGKVYRITYHYHWDRRAQFIGFYDKKLDVNMPMNRYGGNAGSPTYSFDIAAQGEERTYVVHAHHQMSPLGGHWIQVRVSPSTGNTLALGPQDDSIRVGWLSWGILN